MPPPPGHQRTTTGPLCTLTGIGKSYGATRAVSDVSLDLHAGQIHALLGENGAGKSTLMKLLAGAERADTGAIHLEGRPVEFRSVREANAAGIATVFQETMLFGSLDAVENLCNGRFATRRGLIDRARMEAQVRPVLDDLGVHVDLTRPVEELPLPARQLLEIAKALLVDARVLILDEPNSALRQDESERLFTMVNELRGRGVAIVYVSHRLEEVFRLADTVSVLRDGRLVHSGPARELTIPQTITHMLGRERSALAAVRGPEPVAGETVVELQDVGSDVLAGLSLTATRGEIVGLAGLEGAGATEVMKLLFGRCRRHTGAVRVLGQEGAPRSPAAAVRRRIAFVPSDRAGEGLALDASVVDNAVAVHTAVLDSSLLLSHRRLLELARSGFAGIAARVPSFTAPVGSLSGGNQQKVVFAKWRLADPALVLLEDPARGVDVGAKAEIFAAVRHLADTGCATLFVSSDFGDYSLVCDRVLVLRAGKVVDELTGHEASEHALLSAIHQDEADEQLAAQPGPQPGHTPPRTSSTAMTSQ